jgi:putative transposase
VILDIFSRYVVGWMMAHRERAALAERLIPATNAKQVILPEQLRIHADRGPSMTSKPVALLLADLGITRTHHVSNDNPFFEAQFKTLKYRPDFPDRFGSLEAASRHKSEFLANMPHELQELILVLDVGRNRHDLCVAPREQLGVDHRVAHETYASNRP